MLMVDTGLDLMVGMGSLVNLVKASSPFHGCEIKESAFFALIMKRNPLPSRFDLFEAVSG